MAHFHLFFTILSFPCSAPSLSLLTCFCEVLTGTFNPHQKHYTDQTEEKSGPRVCLCFRSVAISWLWLLRTCAAQILQWLCLNETQTPNKTINPSRGRKMTASCAWTAVSWRYPDPNNKSKKWPKETRKQGADGKINHIKVHVCFHASSHLSLYYDMHSDCTDLLICVCGICWGQIWWQSHSISVFFILLHSFSLSRWGWVNSFWVF